jgi:hypothetical protein
MNFIFSKIETIQFATFESYFNKDVEIEFGLNTEFATNEDDKMVVVNVGASFLQKKIPFIKLEVACFFILAKETWDSFINGKNIILPADFARHLLMLTIGTTRGILHSKTEKTQFNEYLIPTINLTQIITDNISFDLENN